MCVFVSDPVSKITFSKYAIVSIESVNLSKSRLKSGVHLIFL